MDIDLCQPLTLPNEFIIRFKAIRNSYFSVEFSEELFEHNHIAALINDIDFYCKSNRIIGVHYTRAMPESISSKGLLIRNGNEIRQKFLDEHGHLFSRDEILDLKIIWSNYFNHVQSSVRDGRICFNFTETAHEQGGAMRLLEVYGGEQISMPIKRSSAIGSKLKLIGKPMIVRCSLDPNQVSTFTENPWGKILFSSYHTLMNPNAYRIDQDGYQSMSVSPDNILDIKVISD